MIAMNVVMIKMIQTRMSPPSRPKLSVSNSPNESMYWFKIAFKNYTSKKFW